MVAQVTARTEDGARSEAEAQPSGGATPALM